MGEGHKTIAEFLEDAQYRTPDDLRQIAYEASDDTPAGQILAFQRFYSAIESYRQGRYQDAFRDAEFVYERLHGKPTQSAQVEVTKREEPGRLVERLRREVVQAPDPPRLESPADEAIGVDAEEQ